MQEASLTTSVQVPNDFTDVLYLTSRDQITSQIERIFEQNKVSFVITPIDKFFLMRDRLNLISTVIIDQVGLDASQQHKLAQIIESLENSDITAIILDDNVESNVEGSLAAQSQSDSSKTTLQVVSTAQLWAAISSNLTNRKKNTPPALEPQSAPSQPRKIHTDNELTTQLLMTEALMDNLSEQLRMAGLVQRDFLPAQLPNSDVLQWATAFFPAEWVSGDIYDVARIDEQHIGFYVADVVGHGIPAALLTIFLKQALVMRQIIENNYRIFPPAEVMKNLNLRMTGQKLSGHQFATSCYCLLNVKTLQLTFARAGHPYPILIRKKQPPQRLEIRGSLLGVFEHAEYFQRTIQLQSGDKLLLYSDGAEPFIGSFDNLTGFHFSEQFCEIKDLPVGRMIERLNACVESKELKPSEVDDITILGLEIL